MSRSLPILVTPGDPAGVGPEVAVKAARFLARPLVLVGDSAAVRAEAARHGLAVAERAVPEGGGVGLVEPPPGAEPVEVRALRWAVEACLTGRAAAIVTGPIHKARLAARGFPHPGHTDFFGALCGVEHPVMAFVGRRLRVALVTVHRPLRAVAAEVTAEGVLRVIRLAHAALRGDLGIADPVLAVCGLNPHAGDAGLLGREEIEVVGPACEQARAAGWRVRGPLPAESAARDAAEGRADMLVAMYHDQGLVPLKLLDFGHAVNWTLGLPIVRTSVDHGTADDIAGQGLADPGSMIAAIELAERIAKRRNPAGEGGAPGVEGAATRG